MKALIAGIISKWQTATAITPSGPWLGMAEDASAYPFGIFTFIGEGRLKQFFGGYKDEELVVRFTVYDDNLSDVADIQANLHTRFDNTSLTLSSGTNFHFVREGQSIRYEGVDKNGVKIYRADSTYRTITSL